jgi:PST family polysaccharide transporter
MAKDIGSKTKQGVLWTVFFDSFEFVLSFGSSVILARLLFPEDFGLMGIASIAIQFARRLATFGFSTVLVQMKEVKEEHYDTVYLMNLLLMLLVAAVLFFGAPYYANFFNNQQLKLIIQVIAFDFILKAFASVPTSILKRYMNFRSIGLSHTIGKVSTLVSTITLAFAGMGVWSLVIGTMFGSFCQRTAVIHFARRYTPWKPRFRFRKWAMKDVFSFGIWVYISSFVHFGVNKIDFFVIGKFLGAVQLGFYERAFSLMSLPRKEIVRKVNAVLFSGFSRIQEDDERVVRGLLRVITYLSMIAYPLMIWLFFVSPSLINVIYGEKWLPAVLPLQIMCLGGISDSFTLIFQPLLRAKGLVAHNAGRDVMYLIILAGAIFATIKWGIVGVSIGVTAASLVGLSLMLHIAIRRLPFTLGQFFKAQKSAIIYGLIQIGVLLFFQWAVHSYFSNDSLPMLIGVSLLSAVTVLTAHFLIRFRDVEDIFQEFFSELKKFVRKLPLIGRWGILQKKG